MLPDFYTMRMSPDGKVIAGFISEDTYLYNLNTEQITELTGFQIGNGNALSGDGRIAVGGTGQDQAGIVIGTELILPENLSSYTLCSLHGITADGTLICGTIENKKGRAPMYVPAVFEVSADGAVSDPILLPYPEKDIFGTAPQFCSAVWISDDGKTVLGQVVADNGMFKYPVLYKKNAIGEWSYTIPGENLLNPNHVEIPENPGDFELTPPQESDFMDPDKAAAWEAALEEYRVNGFIQDQYPNPADYMTKDQIDAFNKASEEYNAYAEAYNQKLFAYQEAILKIMDESVNYVQNAFALSADGKMVAAGAEYSVEDPDSDPEYPSFLVFNPLYIIDVENGTSTKIETKQQMALPDQVLAGGVVVGSTPLPGPMSATVLDPLTYVWYAGLDDWMPIEEYLGKGNPEVATWMKDNLTHYIPVGITEDSQIEYGDVLMSGHALLNSDATIISGGVCAYHYSDDHEYESYIITGMTSGVESTVADAIGSLKALDGGILSVNGTVSNVAVCDLAGATLFSADRLSGNVETGLPAGFYVVRYINAQGQKVSEKVKF